MHWKKEDTPCLHNLYLIHYHCPSPNFPLSFSIISEPRIISMYSFALTLGTHHRRPKADRDGTPDHHPFSKLCLFIEPIVVNRSSAYSTPFVVRGLLKATFDTEDQVRQLRLVVKNPTSELQAQGDLIFSEELTDSWRLVDELEHSYWDISNAIYDNHLRCSGAMRCGSPMRRSGAMRCGSPMRRSGAMRFSGPMRCSSAMRCSGA